MSVSPKVITLLSEGRVSPSGTAATYLVAGDTGSHRIVIGDGFALCTDCRAFAARGTCSHLRAATLINDALVDGVAATVAKAGAA